MHHYYNILQNETIIFRLCSRYCYILVIELDAKPLFSNISATVNNNIKYALGHDGDTGFIYNKKKPPLRNNKFFFFIF